MFSDTIVAVSTPHGRGGIGIVRLSGSGSSNIATALSGQKPEPRRAQFACFRDADGEVIDHGLLIYFRQPVSYTGEDVVELQAHGNPIILQQLVRACCAHGARLARAGEFTERAFQNDKLDLAQAEAVADLIASQSERAARAAARTLSGEFATLVQAIVDNVHLAHAELEAAIDFADDVMADDLVAGQAARITALCDAIATLLNRARVGHRLNQGATLAIIGAPNVGKSSLLNRLAEQERAIVSNIPGTTRDVVDADVLIDGIPVRLLDTAGLRDSQDPLEQEGISRSRQALANADAVLLVVATPIITPPGDLTAELGIPPGDGQTVIVVHNKIDLHNLASSVAEQDGEHHVFLSALSGDGLDLLTATIARLLGVDDHAENEFMARDRHLNALAAAHAELRSIDLKRLDVDPELAAEHYRRASLSLEAIAGRYTSEDLLGEIFGRFCIGK